MSGSDWITAVRIAATIAALISLDTIVRPFFPLALFKDLLHRPDCRGQGPPHLIGQSHPWAHVGRLARDDQAATRPSASITPVRAISEGSTSSTVTVPAG